MNDTPGRVFIEACLLRPFLDCFSASTPKKPAKRGCFSWEKQVSVAPKDVYRPSIFFFPNHYPLALAVNKSPAVYILSPSLDGLSNCASFEITSPMCTTQTPVLKINRINNRKRESRDWSIYWLKFLSLQ